MLTGEILINSLLFEEHVAILLDILLLNKEAGSSKIDRYQLIDSNRKILSIVCRAPEIMSVSQKYAKKLKIIKFLTKQAKISMQCDPTSSSIYKCCTKHLCENIEEIFAAEMEDPTQYFLKKDVKHFLKVIKNQNFDKNNLSDNLIIYNIIDSELIVNNFVFIDSITLDLSIKIINKGYNLFSNKDFNDIERLKKI